MPSLFSEIWVYLTDRYFSTDFFEYDYAHIRLGPSAARSVPAMIVALFLGIIVACAVTLHQRRTLGDLVRALDRERASTPETAKTLGELGLSKSAAIRSALRRGTTYGQSVLRVLGEEETPDKAFDFSTDRFYMPEEKAFSTLSRFDKKGSNPMIFAAVTLACVVLASVCCRFFPELLQFIDNFLGTFHGA